ncbi:MAG: lactate utilization protein [Rhizobiaceae bacterium]|nr:lactate utilization protein [Rhizobiaceae bacterium]
MSARDAILNRVRNALKPGASEAERRRLVDERLTAAPNGVIPARGQLPEQERVALFCTMAQKIAATIERVGKADDVPKAVTQYLRAKNLPASVRMGADGRLAAMPWAKQRSLTVKSGPSDGDDEVGVSHALGGVAETGTVVMESGPANPTTINFLPEHHIVVVDAKDVAGDLEAVLERVRRAYGKGEMPRTLNLISGPSRSGDIEQKIILGAHGPRALHLIVVG